MLSRARSRKGRLGYGDQGGNAVFWILIMVLGVVVGFVAGYTSPVVPNVLYARYLSIAVMASLDSTFGGLRASLDGKYDNAVFISGFFTNMVMAAGLIYLGDRLGVQDLYLAGIVALGTRVFHNLGIIRRRLFERWGIIGGATTASAPNQPKSL